MVLAVALLVNNLGLFFFEVIGYHLCHSVVMLLDGYYHLCLAILCVLRIVSPRIQFTYTSRHTYGLARVGVVGELITFISFISLSVSVFFETIKHLIDVTFVLPKRESLNGTVLSPHGHEHIHSLIDNHEYILGVGIYATISNCLLGVAILYTLMKRSKKLKEQLKKSSSSLQLPLPKNLLSKSLLITDTLSIHHSFFQVFNMLIGPLALFICGLLLFILTETHVRRIFTRLVDPIIACLLFLSYIFMISRPIRDVIQLVLQAKPNGLKSDEIETAVRASISGVVGIHELHIWRLTPQKTLATVHVVFNTDKDILRKYQGINYIFQMNYIDHVTIQPEFVSSNDEIEKLNCLYQCSNGERQCSPLQCCESSETALVSRKSPLPKTVHFHRRSSVGLPSVDSTSEFPSEQEDVTINNSTPIIASSSANNLPVTTVHVNNEK